MIKEFGEPFSIDRNINEGGILFYVREYILAKLLSVETLPTESFFAEINLRKKWLVFCFYSRHRDNISNHLQTISKGLNYIYHSIIILL